MTNEIHVAVAPELVTQVLTEGHELHTQCVRGLPPGAELVWAQASSEPSGRFVIDLRFEVAAGCDLPARFDPVFENRGTL